jgi:DHA1 family bicyclomycin/chloramphenicol resistance-like MFS transporter
MGTLSDVHGRRKPLLISMILYFLSSLGCAFALNIEMFIAFRFIQGFFAAAGLVISRAIVRDMYSGIELTKFFALLTMFSNVAPLVSPLAGSVVISFTSWNGVFIFTGILGIFLTFITTWRIKETLPIEQRVSRNFSELLGNFKTLLLNRVFMGYALVSGTLFAGVFAYVSGSSFVYQNIYGVTPQVFSVLFSLNGISLILGAQLVKLLAGRFTDHSILVFSLSIALISGIALVIVIYSQGPLWALVFSLFLLIFANGIIAPITFTLAMESQGHIAGSASALLGILPSLFGSITSPLVGIAGEFSAIPLGMIIFITSLLAVFSYVFLVKNSKNLSVSKKAS